MRPAAPLLHTLTSRRPQQGWLHAPTTRLVAPTTYERMHPSARMQPSSRHPFNCPTQCTRKACPLNTSTCCRDCPPRRLHTPAHPPTHCSTQKHPRSWVAETHTCACIAHSCCVSKPPGLHPSPALWCLPSCCCVSKPPGPQPARSYPGGWFLPYCGAPTRLLLQPASQTVPVASCVNSRLVPQHCRKLRPACKAAAPPTSGG